MNEYLPSPNVVFWSEYYFDLLLHVHFKLSNGNMSFYARYMSTTVNTKNPPVIFIEKYKSMAGSVKTYRQINFKSKLICNT